MALKRIEPNVSDKTLTTRVHREYADIDLGFNRKAGTIFEDGVRRGDVFKKEAVKSIDQSISNILTTNKGEKPFDPGFGSDLRRLLFELNTTLAQDDVKQIVIRSLERDEPRVRVLDVTIFDLGAEREVPRGIDNVFFFSSSNSDDDRYSLSVTAHCIILNTGQEIKTSINMNRLR